jgi:hypothetical protein
MQSLRDRPRNPWIVAGAAFLAGLILGWLVLGWWIWPVDFIDATPAELRADLRIDYLRAAVDSFAVTGDANTARQRFAALGSSGAETLGLLQRDPSVDQGRLSQYLSVVSDIIPTGGGKVTPPPGGTSAPGTSLLGATRSLVLIFLGLCLVTLVLGGVLVLVLRRRRTTAAGPQPNEGQQPPAAQAAPAERPVGATPVPGTAPLAAAAPETVALGGTGPLERFVTTYVLGDDLYEDSFTINSPAGEFLGECGVGISEQVGVGEPKKVTAFEVWLFDKRDTRTSTYVLVSEYAMHRDDVRSRLAPRGTPLEALAGTDFWMETQTLKTHVQVREVQYGRGALPANSFFDRMTLQLEVWAKS